MVRVANIRGWYIFFIAFLVLFTIIEPLPAQILQQHFDTLNSLAEFQHPTAPNEGQVNRINLNQVDLDGSDIFSLGVEEGGNKFLHVHKQGRRTRHFDRTSGIDNAPTLVISFDFELISIEREGRIAGWFLGDQLGNTSFAPARVEKWAEIGIFADPSNNSFSLSNERESMSFQSNNSYTGKRKIRIIANNSGEHLLYEDPAGSLTLIPDENVHLWVDGERQLVSSRPFLGESARKINAVKFLLRNTTMNAVFHIDNVLIEELEIIPLPVELKDFSARVEDEDVLLQWQTASEKDHSHFEVERSLDGSTFIPLGRIPSAGNSTTKQSYSYTDRHAARELAGTVYYRLKMIDIDHTYEYSPVQTVSLTDRSFELLSISPNPFRETLSLEIQAAKAQLVEIELLDQQGTLLLRQEEQLIPGLPELSIRELDKLSPGIYFLRIKAAEFQGHYRLVKL